MTFKILFYAYREKMHGTSKIKFFRVKIRNFHQNTTFRYGQNLYITLQFI